MKAQSNYVSDGELQAYVDGLLSSEDRSRVESFLSFCPEERERLDAYRRHNVLLHRLYDWPAHRAHPTSYDPLVRKLSRKMRVQRCMSGAVRAAAAVGVISVVGAAGWASYDRLLPNRAPLLAFGGQGTDRYVRLVGDGRIMAGSDKNSDAIAKKSAEMLGSLPAQRFGMPRQAPDFEKAGFRLVGVRTLSTAYGPAIQLLYENDKDRRVTLFLRPNTNLHATGPAAADHGDVSMVYSEIDKMAYSLVGNVDRRTLLNLATQVSDTLTTVAAGEPTSSTSEKSRPKDEPTADSMPTGGAPTENNAPDRSHGLDRNGAVSPDARPDRPPAVIKAGLKPPA